VTAGFVPKNALERALMEAVADAAARAAFYRVLLESPRRPRACRAIMV